MRRKLNKEELLEPKQNIMFKRSYIWFKRSYLWFKVTTFKGFSEPLRPLLFYLILYIIPISIDTKLYNKVFKEADVVFKKPSAYKSMWIQKEYKKQGGNVFNRLVLFNVHRYHMSMDYFGDTKENGRLFLRLSKANSH
jgi:hypothetical protein